MEIFSRFVRVNKRKTSWSFYSMLKNYLYSSKVAVAIYDYYCYKPSTTITYNCILHK